MRWPGRGQVHRVGDLHYIFDVAHNRAAVGALARILADLAPPRPLVVLAGILGDKDWSRMLPPLVDLADRVVFTIPVLRAAGEELGPARGRVGGGRRRVPIDVVDEVASRGGARSRVWPANGTVVVTGSCHTVGDALQILGVSPFGSD